MKQFFFLILPLLLFVGSASAQNTMTAGTTWEGGTWSAGHVPTSGENVVITSGLTPSINSSAVCNNITIGTASNANTSLVVSSGFSLTVGGSVSINPAGNALQYRLRAGSGSITIAGNVTVNATGDNQITVSNGNLTFNRGSGITWSTGALSILGTGTISFAGPFTQSGGTVDCATTAGTFTFNDNFTRSGGTFTTYHGVEINAAGNFTNSGSALVLDSASTTKFSATSTITPTAAITFGKISILTGSAVTLAGNITVDANFTVSGTGTLSGGTNTVTLTGEDNFVNGSASAISFPKLVIASGAHYTVDSDFTCTQLTFNSAADSSSLRHADAGIGVTVNGNVIINHPSVSNRASSWFINDGSAAVTGNVTIGSNSGTASRIAEIVVNAGSLGVSGNLDFSSTSSANAHLNFDGGSGTLNVGGNMTKSTSGTFSKGTGTVTFNGTSTSIHAFSFYNAAFSGSGTKTLTGALTIYNNLSVTGGTLELSTFTANRNSSGGTISVSNGATLKIGGTNSIPSNYSTRTFGSTSTVLYSGTDQSVGGESYGHLTLAASGTSTLASNTTAAGNLSVSSGIFDLGAFTANRTSAGGTLTVSSGATLKIGGTNSMPTNYSTHSIGSTSTVEYSGTSQTVTGESYGTLVLSGSGTKTPSGNSTLFGDLSIAGGTLDLTTYSANRNSLGGTLTVSNGATLKIGGTNTFPSNYSTRTFGSLGTVEYSGTDQSISAQSYGNLTISGSGTKTPAGNMTIAGDLFVSAGTFDLAAFTANRTAEGGTLTVASGAAMKIGGSNTFPYNYSTHSLGSTSTIENNGTGQPVSNETYGNLILSGSGTATLSGTASVVGDLTVTSGTFFLSTYTANRSTAGGTLTVSNGAALKIGGTNTIPSNYSTHSFGSTSTIEYSGTNQTVAAESYGNLSLSGTATKTLPGTSLSIPGTFSISGATIAALLNSLSMSSFNQSSGTFNDGGFQITVTGTGASVWTKTGGTFTTTGTTEFQGASPSISASNFKNLTLSGSGTATLTGNATITGNLTLSNGTFDLSSFNANRSTAGGTMTISNGTTLKIGGSGTLPSNYSTHSIGSTSTVNYAGSTTVAAGLNSSQNYGNLTISGTAVTSSADLSVTGAMTISAGAAFTSTGTVTFSGGDALYTNTGTGTLGNVVLNKNSTNTLSLSGDMTIGGILTLTSGYIRTDMNVVDITNSATGNVIATNGIINGRVRRTMANDGSTYLFNDASTSVTRASGTNPTSLLLESNPNTYILYGNNSNAAKRYYTAQALGESGTWNITLSYRNTAGGTDTDERNSLTENDLKLFSGNGSVWSVIGSTQSSAVNPPNSGKVSGVISEFTDLTVAVSFPPFVSSDAATSVGASSATMNGTVNANGASTTVRFLYGTVSGVYTDSIVAAESPVSAATSVAVSVGLSALNPTTQYFYRVSAENPNGYARGAESNFTTSVVLISSLSPARNELNISSSTTIQVIFNSEMLPGSINDTTSFIVTGISSGRHRGAITFSNNNSTALFTPAVSFQKGELVTVQLTSNLKNITNNSLPQTVYSFVVGTAISTGSFASMVNYATGTDPHALFVNDLDGDGDGDIAAVVIGTNKVSILKNNGNGTFATKVDYTTGSSPQAIFVSDVDADGDGDLVIGNLNSNTVSIMMNNGNAAFAAKVDYAAGTNPRGVFISDLDGDGDGDLIAVNQGSNTVSILMNNGNGTFAAKTDYTTGSSPRSVFVNDLDMDGDGDLAIANPASNTISILKNNGNGTFAGKTDYTAGNYPVSIFVYDLDGDGDGDIATAGYSANSVSILKNNGNGTFASKIDYSADAAPYSLFISDVDGDGDGDIVVPTVYYGNLIVLKNSGTGTFASKTTYAVGSYPKAAFVADLDGDGDGDIVVAKGDNSTVSILKGTSMPTAVTTAATNIGAQTVRMNGTVNAGDVSTTVRFVYGTVSGTYTDSITATQSPVTGSVSTAVSASAVSLTHNTQYFFKVAVENTLGYLRGSELSVTTQTPLISVQSGTMTFASTVPGDSSAALSYTISGSYLIDSLRLSAPSGFRISKTSSSGYTTSLAYNRTNETLDTATVYARFVPESAGATGSLNITHSALSAVTKNKVVTATGLSAQPTTQSSALLFSSIGRTSMTISWTKGNGSNRIVFVKSGSALSSNPVDGTLYTANSVFMSGTQIGAGNYVVYKDTGSSVTITGLTAAERYYVGVFEFNGSGMTANFKTTDSLIGSSVTTVPAFAVTPGTGLLFDGSDDNVNAGTSISLANKAFSIEFWAKRLAGGGGTEDYICGLGSSGTTNNLLHIGFRSTNVFTFSFYGNDVNTSAVYTDSVWHHWAVVYDTTETKTQNIYRDGILVASRTTTSNFTGSGTFVMGMSQANTNFPGTLDEFRVWNVARTQQQIRENMYRTLSGTQSNLLAYWQFNEGTGTAAVDSVSLINAALTNFAVPNWVTSTIPVGIGKSSSLSSFSTGTASLDSVSLTTTNAFDNAVDLTATEIDTIPNDIPSGYSGIIGNKYFVVNTYGTPGTFSTNLSFKFGPNALDTRVDAFPAGVKLYKRDSNSDSAWTLFGGAASANSSTGIVTWNGITSFSQFAAVYEESALPVELVSFSASSQRLNAELKWKTATEVNNHGFEIQRSKVSGRRSEINGHSDSDSERSEEEEEESRAWTKLGFVEGNGSSNTVHGYSFTDRIVSAGTYDYRLKQIDRDGKFSYSSEVEVMIGSVPLIFALEQNYPNPFNPSTTIGFTLQESGPTTLKVYDMLGREVATLVNEHLEAGTYHQKTFDASRLASGLYFVRLSSGDKISMKKMLLIK